MLPQNTDGAKKSVLGKEKNRRNDYRKAEVMTSECLVKKKQLHINAQVVQNGKNQFQNRWDEFVFLGIIHPKEEKARLWV